jgi:ribosomal protein S18 acetylase RimI-like enzyme
MSATVRIAKPGDECVLADLNSFVHALHVAQRPKYFKRARTSEVRDWFKDFLGKANSRIFIAEENGAPLGYASVVIHDRPENPFAFARRWHEIDQIAVDPRHRRMGVARTLVRAITDEARERGVRDLEVTSWSFNKEAQAAFRRFGFAPKVIRFSLELDA